MRLGLSALSCGVLFVFVCHETSQSPPVALSCMYELLGQDKRTRPVCVERLHWRCREL
jgi:hypothetical protein